MPPSYASYCAVRSPALLAVKEKVSPDTPDSDRETPSPCAARHRHKVLVRLFIANEGVTRGYRDSLGREILWWEVVHGPEDIIELPAM
ncbi:hypothetical protein F1880_001857 [Penicillium rolfsii]|nr:hypothetical protein F1880_001857 [Penicillium rolfsii]